MKLGVEDIAKKKEDHIKIVAYDCHTDDQEVLKNFPYCADDIRAKLPILFFLEPILNPVDDNDTPNPKSHNYAGNLQEKALYDFAV